jgi:ABC-2 type transport system permease protein
MLSLPKVVRDSGLVLGNSVAKTVREPVWVVIALLQPIFYLVLFGPLLTRLVGVPGFPGGNAYAVFVPGLLIQLGLFGTVFVGFGLIALLRHGVIERMRVTPVSRLALLLGMVLRDVVTLGLQATILVLLALPLGLSVRLGPLLLTLALVMLIGVAFSAASYAVALALRTDEGLASVLNGLTLPVLLLSGILLPLSLAPGWLRHIAQANPLSYAVTAARALFAGQVATATVVRGVAVMAAVAVLTVGWAARSFNRSVG